ncbi:MAG: SCP2 sterol-binding domain-containing protein [Spirochaetes bacterium]|nr:SCP2 sterol-binding domain-containing protein [Spirochaetota bacterium]
MKFSLLLYGLLKLMQRTAKKVPEFKKKLKEKDYTVLIKTEDGKKGRTFTFAGGEISSRGGTESAADLTLSWKDAATGFRIMSKGKTKAFIAALQDGSLKLQGDGNLVPVFLGAVKDMLKGLKK